MEKAWTHEEYETLDREIDRFICQLSTAKNRKYQDVLHKVRSILGHKVGLPDVKVYREYKCVRLIDSEKQLIGIIMDLLSCPQEWTSVTVSDVLLFKIENCNADKLRLEVFTKLFHRMSCMAGWRIGNDGEETPDCNDA